MARRRTQLRRMPVLFHRDQLRHRPRFEWSEGKRIEHFEREMRPSRILEALEGSEHFEIHAPTGPIRMLELERTHAPAMVRYLRSACRGLTSGAFYPNVFPKRYRVSAPTGGLPRAGYFCLDAGTPLTRWAYEAARLAAACAAEGATRLLRGKDEEVYALCRPPGHHAEPDLYGGYCYFNNAAIAARRLRERGRVAIVDVDFHHGNGTQAIFWTDPDVLFVSIHGDPEEFYPYFSGFEDEVGEGPGKGTNLNIPLPAGTGESEYRGVLERRVLPALRAFRPASLVISAGFDTFSADPIGEFLLGTSFYAEMGERFARLGLPTLIVQEGGYQVRQLGENVRTFLTGFLQGRRTPRRT